MQQNVTDSECSDRSRITGASRFETWLILRSSNSDGGVLFGPGREGQGTDWAGRLVVTIMTSTTADENKELIREHVEAWVAGDLDTMVEQLADTYSTSYTAPTGEERHIDAEEFRGIMARTHESFSGLTYEIHEMVAEDDRVMFRMTYSGIHDGDFFGIASTDNRIEVEESLSFRVENNQIVENHWLGDHLGLVRQLDVDLPIER